MSSTVAIAAASSAALAAADAQAAARKAECRVTTTSYDAHTATVEQARDYASCVYTLYGTGEPMSSSAVVLVKILIGLAFLGAGIGGYKGFQEDGFVGGAMFGFMGACLLPIGAGIIAAAGAGLVFLFS